MQSNPPTTPSLPSSSAASSPSSSAASSPSSSAASSPSSSAASSPSSSAASSPSSPAASSPATPSPSNSPFTYPTVYHDNVLERLFITLFSRKMARALGTKHVSPGYSGFVTLSKQIMVGRTSKEQQQLVAIVLQSLVPAPILWGIRTFFSPTQWVCEWNAWFATQLFEWLVGPCEVTTTDVTTAEGTVRAQASNVHIKKCRYLEQSRCVGLCVNMCKIPTQTFFTEKFGIPLTMTPNFEDLSCEMTFGQVAPKLEQEDVYKHPCFISDCPTAAPQASTCPQVRGT